SAPLEQVESQLLFEPANLLADGTVGQMQHVGRGAQILQLGDGSKRGERVEWQARHGCPLVSGTYQNGQNKSIPRASLALYAHQRLSHARERRLAAGIVRPHSTARWLIAVVAVSLSAGVLMAALVPGWIGADRGAAPPSAKSATATAGSGDAMTIY